MRHMQFFLIIVIASTIGGSVFGEAVKQTPSVLLSKQESVVKLYPIYKAGKWGFMDRKGKVLVPLQFAWLDDPCVTSYWQPYEKLAPVQIEKKWGYVDAHGDVVVAPRFDFAGRFVNGLAKVGKASANAAERGTGYIDESGQFVIPLQSLGWGGDFGADGWASVSLPDGQRGRMDRKGHSERDSEREVSSGVPLYPVRQGELYGYKNPKGDFVIEPKFTVAYPFVNGYAFVYVGGHGNSSNRRFGEGQWGCIDVSGKRVIEPQFDDVIASRGGPNPVRKNGKWGFIQAGRIVVPPQYDSTGMFQQGVCPVQQDGKRFYIDEEFKPVSPDDERIFLVRFHQGLASIKRDGKYGFENRKGELVIPAQWDDVSEFNEDGVARVQFGYTPHKVGWINIKGEYLWEPQN